MKSVRFERGGDVGSIVLSNPPQNRIDSKFAAGLGEAVHEASESNIRVLIVRAEGPNFCLGGDAREWLGKDVNWFRTFIAEVNASYRALEALRIPTVAVVHGAAFGGGYELALACDMIIAAETAIFRSGEVGIAMVPNAGAVQRLADRVGRARAARLLMMAESISGTDAAALGIVTHVVPAQDLERTTAEVAQRLSDGPTRAYAAIRALLKVWSSAGVATADVAMLDFNMDLFESEDAKKGIANVAKALDTGVEPTSITFAGK